MSMTSSCPRCHGELRPPGLWSSSWTCDAHGAVPPYCVVPTPNERGIAHVVERANVPVWVPRPLPVGWLITGIGYAGDDRTGACATAIACSGPSPLGGPADLLLVAEEPGVGLGARYAGLPAPDAGLCAEGAPYAKVEAAGHPTAMWLAETPPDRVAFVGEAKGLWLWAVLWPDTASLLFLEHVVLQDLRDNGPVIDLGLSFGAASPRLHEAAAV